MFPLLEVEHLYCPTVSLVAYAIEAIHASVALHRMNPVVEQCS